MAFDLLSFKLYGESLAHVARRQAREQGRKMGTLLCPPKKAKEEGFQEGYHEGLQVGWLEGLQRSVICCVFTRFPPPTNNLRDRIYKIKTDSVLENILDDVVMQKGLRSIKKMIAVALRLQRRHKKRHSA